MESSFIQIKDALTKLLKGIDPDVDVFFEEMNFTEGTDGIREPERYYFLRMKEIENSTVDQYYTDIGIQIEITYHGKSKSNMAYLLKTAELEKAVRPVFSFGDRHITVSNVNSKVTDCVLYYSFSIRFRQAWNEIISSQKMGELCMTMKKGE